MSMWRATICFCVALSLGIPALAHAQSMYDDSQHPDDYTDEDSNPLAIASYFLYPVGWAVEWGIARPLKWGATKGPLAFMYKPIDADDEGPPPPIAYIPDNSLNESASPIPAPVSGAPAVSPPNYGVARPPAQQPIAPGGGQPALH
jgi:hypothetical protein